MLFANFTENLRDFLEISPDSLILIVPSTRDAISEHIAFPQGRLETGFSGDPVSPALAHIQRQSLIS